MATEVFFNRPKRPIDTSRIIADILSARYKLYVASAWFTDTEIADAFIASPAANKGALFNAADINRNSRAAYKRLDSYFVKWNASKAECWALWPAWEGIFVIGSHDNWQEGVMHHKFILVDDSIVWVGSYNFTFQARSNYENLLRIDDKETVAQFWNEVYELVEEYKLYYGGVQFAKTNGVFRCAECEQLCKDNSIGADYGSVIICKSCLDRRGQSEVAAMMR